VAVHPVVVVAMTAEVAARVHADDEPGEEDHRDDKCDTGDDADPGGDLEKSVGPIRANGCRFGLGLRCLGHVWMIPTPTSDG
jgi:hypothetical protein